MNYSLPIHFSEIKFVATNSLYMYNRWCRNKHKAMDEEGNYVQTLEL